MTTQAKRRFIAGAKCPNCSSVDTLFVLAGALNETVECAQCGQQETQTTQADLQPKVREDNAIQAVKFVDPE